METNNQNSGAAPNQNNTAVQQKFSDDTITGVLERVGAYTKKGDLMLPKDYSAENAVRSAWLIIQQTVDMSKRPALEVCTKASIANALFDMVLQGLSPTKKQCYFIVYGNKLEMQKSYFGTIAISKRVAGVKDAIGIPLFTDDVFEYKIDITTGIKTVTKHEQKFENIDVTKLKGAYAVVTYEDGRVEYEIMTMQQIRASWNMGKASGNSPAHKNFPDQMACKTVISRALKIPVNSSSDDDLFEPENGADKSRQVTEEVKLQITENANKEPGLGFTDDGQPQGNENFAEAEVITNDPSVVAETPQPIQPSNPDEKKAPF